MTTLTFLSPPESSHTRALKIISEFMSIVHEQRTTAQLQFEDMMLRREMPVEAAYKAAILNLKG